ncbi:hypothetical protein MNAN1_002745 [Malassezia nana]|uniref:Brl1/Brr6 domain-containing protein n=1 Tax=Malassezia nana TaxID=180528 RepID=A0AAF0ENH5_9BASI|nr:hypothetical protein MNAN1_002745 [Malassezia nana]
MAYVRGTQAPMDLTEPGPRQPSIFDAPSVAPAGPMDMTPDASLMDLDPESPAHAPPGLPPVHLLASAPEEPKEECAVPAPAVSSVGDSLVLRAAPGAPAPPASAPPASAPPASAAQPPAQPSTPSVLERPELLLTYAQVLFNASIIFVFMYLLFSLVWTIQRDVSQKVREYELDYLGEIASCSSSYEQNRCGSDTQAPALSELCESWKRCAARDPTVVGRARVTAETFAEILNGFVDAVSWKTMLFSLLTLSIVVGATNSTLSFFRVNARHAHENPPPPPPEAAYASAYYPYSIAPDWHGSAPPVRRRTNESAPIPYPAS